MEVVVQPANQVDSHTRSKLRSLTLRQEGVMSKVLGQIATNPEAAALSQVIMLRDEKLRVLGWGLWHNDRVMVYVRKNYRGLGLATRILQVAKERFSADTLLTVYNFKLASPGRAVYVPFSCDNVKGWALWKGEDL